MNINYQLKNKEQRRTEPFRPNEQIPFGQLRTDHMFLIDFNGSEWANARVVPYGNLSLVPGAVALHYGQELFEGAKAFPHSDGDLYTFRLEKNAARLNFSAQLLCMQTIPEEMQIEAIHALLNVERLWAPEMEGASLYIRPFMFGTEDTLGVKPSKTYTYCVFISPSGPYYAAGFSKPVKLLITKRFHRASPGGTGAAKAAGNYAASLGAGTFAKKFGASQVLYLDCNNHYIEEAGAMNHFHVTQDGELVIPDFTDTILKSITSESMIELAGSIGLSVKRGKISLDEFINDVKSGRIVEAGGLGTAAVITAVGSYVFEDGSELTVGKGDVGPISRKMYTLLTDIQYGRSKGPEGWVRKVARIC